MLSDQIICVNLGGSSPYQDLRIVEVGTKSRTYTKEQAIYLIQQRQMSFYTVDPYTHMRADVRVEYLNGVPYLTTAADSSKRNNLLSLNTCTLRPTF